jgi:hypothetical protein
MTKSDLPETLYVPALQVQLGSIDFQISHENGFVLLAWRDGATATKWLESGGIELYKQHDSAFAHNLSIKPSKVVVTIRERDEFLSHNTSTSKATGMKRSVHFEPNLGSLFSPPDRQIALE